MEVSLSGEQKFDLAITAGAFIALYWILYIDPLTGIAAVSLGGAAPATILYQTPAGNWLVGSQPLPLALGSMLTVVLIALVGRRSLAATFGTDKPTPA